MPDRDRHEGPHRLPPITRTHTAGGSQHPAGGRVQAVKGADPCDREPWPEARHGTGSMSGRALQALAWQHDPAAGAGFSVDAGS